MAEEGVMFHRDTTLSDGSDGDDTDELKGLGAVEGPFPCQSASGSKRHFTGHSTTRRPMLFSKTILRSPARKAGTVLRWFDEGTRWRLVVSSKENAIEVRKDDGESLHFLFEQSVFGCVWDLQQLPLDDFPSHIFEALQERRREHEGGQGGCWDLLVATSDSGQLCLLDIDPVRSHIRCVDQMPLPTSPKLEQVWAGAGCLPAARTYLGHLVRVEERGRALALAGLEDFVSVIGLLRGHEAADRGRAEDKERGKGESSRVLRGREVEGLAGGGRDGGGGGGAGILPRSGERGQVANVRGAVVDAVFVELGQGGEGGAGSVGRVHLAVLVMRRGEGGLASVVVLGAEPGGSGGCEVVLTLAAQTCLLGIARLPGRPDSVLLASEGCVYVADLGASTEREGEEATVAEEEEEEEEAISGQEKEEERAVRPWPWSPIPVPAAGVGSAMVDELKPPELVTCMAWVGGWGCRLGMCRCGARGLGVGAAGGQRGCAVSLGERRCESRVLIGMEAGEMWVGEVKAKAEGGVRKSEADGGGGREEVELEVVKCEDGGMECASITPLLGGRFMLLRDAGDGRVAQLEESADGVLLRRTETILGLGPTPDFAVVGGGGGDGGGSRERELVVCSGLGRHSALRRLRAGSRLQIHGESAPGDYEQVTGLWAVGWQAVQRRSRGWGPRMETEFNSLLVVSFTNGSRVLTVGGELRDATDEVGLDANASSILVASTGEGLLVQVSEQSILFVQQPGLLSHGDFNACAPSSSMRCQWSPPPATSISVACMCEHVLLCCTSGGSSMHVIDARGQPSGPGALRIRGEVLRFRAAAEVSCMTVIRTGEHGAAGGDAMNDSSESTFLAVVGMYGNVDTGRGASVEVMAIDVAGKRVVVLQTVELGQYSDGDGAGTVPQSVEGLAVEGRGLHMLVALRNGRVINMRMDASGLGLAAIVGSVEVALHGVKLEPGRESSAPQAPIACTHPLPLLDRATVRRLGECPVTLIRVVHPLGPALMAIGQDRGYLITPLPSSLRFQRVSFPAGGVSHLAPFCCRASPQGMAIISEGRLYLASIDPTQALDVTSIPVANPVPRHATRAPGSGGGHAGGGAGDGDVDRQPAVRDDTMAARVVWLEASKCLVVACNRTGERGAERDGGVGCDLRVVDEESEEVVCVAPLGAEERVRCMGLFRHWTGETFVCVGTSRVRRVGREGAAARSHSGRGGGERGGTDWGDGSWVQAESGGAHAGEGAMEEEGGQAQQEGSRKGGGEQQGDGLQQGGAGRGRGRGCGPRLMVWRVWRDCESGAARIRCIASTGLKGACMAVCQYQGYIACTAGERVLLLELARGGSSAPSSPFRLSLVVPQESEADARNSVGSAAEPRRNAGSAGSEWGEDADSWWALSRAAERLCRMPVTSLAAQGTSLVVGDVADAFSLWRVATPLSSGQSVHGAVGTEDGCEALLCAALLPDARTMDIVFRVSPREAAGPEPVQAASWIQRGLRQAAMPGAGRGEPGKGGAAPLVEEREPEVSLLVGFDSPPSAVSFDARLGPLLLREAGLQGEVVATHKVDLSRAGRSGAGQRARRKRVFLSVVSSGGAAVPSWWSLTSYQVHSMDMSALRNCIPQQLDCRGGPGAVVAGGKAAPGEEEEAKGKEDKGRRGAKTIILYGSAGQSALVYVGNGKQQREDGAREGAAEPGPRVDPHVGLHHTFGESPQVDEQVVLKISGWSSDSVLTVSVRGARESELMSMALREETPDGVILQAPPDEELVFFREWGDGASRVAVSGVAWGEGCGILGVDAAGQLLLLHHEQPDPHGRLPTKAIMAGANILATSQIALGEPSWVLREGSLLCPHQNLAAEQLMLLESQASLPSRPHVALAMSFQGTLVAVLGLQEGAGSGELLKLQAHLLRDPLTAPVLGHSYRHYRSASSPMKGVLDGDLLGAFLELSLEQQSRLSKDAGVALSPRHLCELIDALNHLVA